MHVVIVIVIVIHAVAAHSLSVFITYCFRYFRMTVS